ncbi:hypothetical protein C0J52_25642 [Blattella germanica]|nr:hypothetical protein C0J52_25642 [Blattella germanica]
MRWFRFVAMFTSNQLLEFMAQVMGAFQEIFNKAPPRKATLLNYWERRAFGFGSIKDRLRSGRKKTREETCAGMCIRDRFSAMQMCVENETNKTKYYNLLLIDRPILFASTIHALRILNAELEGLFSLGGRTVTLASAVSINGFSLSTPKNLTADPEPLPNLKDMSTVFSLYRQIIFASHHSLILAEVRLNLCYQHNTQYFPAESYSVIFMLAHDTIESRRRSIQAASLQMPKFPSRQYLAFKLVTIVDRLNTTSIAEVEETFLMKASVSKKESEDTFPQSTFGMIAHALLSLLGGLHRFNEKCSPYNLLKVSLLMLWRCWITVSF